MASATTWQVEFFEKQKPQVSDCLTLHMKSISSVFTPQVKEMIRKAKEWRDKEWKYDGEGRPSSYLMSLLVVAAYQRDPKK